MSKSITPFVKGFVKVLPVLVLLVMAAGAVHVVLAAQQVPTCTVGPCDVNSADDFTAAVNKVALFMFNLLMALAVVFLIVAALFYLTAAGNQAQLDKAKNTLVYAIVAIVIGLIAGGIATFVHGLLV